MFINYQAQEHKHRDQKQRIHDIHQFRDKYMQRFWRMQSATAVAEYTERNCGKYCKPRTGSWHLSWENAIRKPHTYQIFATVFRGIDSILRQRPHTGRRIRSGKRPSTGKLSGLGQHLFITLENSDDFSNDRLPVCSTSTRIVSVVDYPHYYFIYYYFKLRYAKMTFIVMVCLFQKRYASPSPPLPQMQSSRNSTLPQLHHKHIDREEVKSISQ